MSSVLFSRGVNSQGNNPLRNEINRVIALNTTLERRVTTLERALVDLQKQPAGAVGPAGPRGEVGPRGEAGPRGEKGDKGDKGDSAN